jgi:hypothetical protein
MRVAALGLLLFGCGPVLLGEDDGGIRRTDGEDASVVESNAGAIIMDAGTPPALTLTLVPMDCGRCVEVRAQASGGRPPYEFQWNDGLRSAQRRVCAMDDGPLSVRATDAASAQSAEQTILVDGLVDAACPQLPAMPPAAATPPSAAKPPLLCLKNLSFEGTPVVNLGLPDAFDAPPWSACTDLADSTAVTNAPDIADGTIGQSFADVPMPAEGPTFLALADGEQVSQPFCSPAQEDSPSYLELDLMRVDVNTVPSISPPTGTVFLEIHGGLSVDCSQRELLWASGALTYGWKRYCVPLRLRGFYTQLTLRAKSNTTSGSSAYVLVDNLKPVDSCP